MEKTSVKEENLKNYNLETFFQDLEELNISLDEKQLCQFMQYYELLIKWNQVINLTAITDFDEVLKKHFIDSLTLVKIFDFNRNDNLCADQSENHNADNITLIDIGTGAGFPGIPLKIAFPDLQVTLMDCLSKRVDFLNKVISVLELDGIEAIHGRAEDYAKPDLLREKYDLCVSRAVTNLAALSEYCLPYVKTGGRFIAYKSEKITEEMKNAEYAIHLLGGEVEQQVGFTLPHSELYRNLFVVIKKKETPAKYPRKAGIVTKKPLSSRKFHKER